MSLPTIDRSSVAARVAVLREHIRTAEVELARQALTLAMHPEDAAAAANIDELRTEIQSHQKAIELLELALQEASRQTVFVDHEEAKLLHETRMGQLDVANGQIEAHVLAILAHLEALAPKLTQLDEALRERRGLAWAICTAALGADQALKRCRVQLERAATTDVTVAVLLQAVQASGLGRIGPNLQPFLSFSNPIPKPMERAQIRSRLQTCNERLASLIAGEVVPAYAGGQLAVSQPDGEPA